MNKKIRQIPASGEMPGYTVLDLFSGIGGFSLGLTRAGFRTTAFCEIEEYPRSILRKHWPDVPIFEDVRELHAADLPEPVDVICGGYPCQPFSLAGQRKGKDDDRHLWPEIVRIIRELDATTGKPAWCIFENVAGHVSMGLDQVLFDLEAEGYAAWPFIVPACAVNAPHRRDRVWIVAHAKHAKRREKLRSCDGLAGADGLPQREESTSGPGTRSEIIADTSRQLLDRGRNLWTGRGTEPANSGCPTTDTDHPRPQGRGELGEPEAGRKAQGRNGYDFAGSDFGKLTNTEWITLPGVRARNDGLPGRVARLKALGNAVVPQIPELLGRCIKAV